MQRATTPEASTADTGHFAGAGARGRRPADHTFQWLIDSASIGNAVRLGEFRAGVTGALIGGIGTIAVAFVWMALFPELRRIRAYDG